MLDGGESAVTGSAAVCAADCVADLVYYAAEGERLVGLVKTRRLKYPPLAGADDPGTTGSDMIATDIMRGLNT